MADREKVMQALKLCAAGCDDTGCIYDEETNGTDFRCVDYLTRDVLELLKEQEAQSVLSNRVCEAEPFRYVRKGFCPKCHQELEWLFNRKHCGFCGQVVKWIE